MAETLNVFKAGLSDVYRQARVSLRLISDTDRAEERAHRVFGSGVWVSNSCDRRHFSGGEFSYLRNKWLHCKTPHKKMSFRACEKSAFCNINDSKSRFLTTFEMTLNMSWFHFTKYILLDHINQRPHSTYRNFHLISRFQENRWFAGKAYARGGACHYDSSRLHRCYL